MTSGSDIHFYRDDCLGGMLFEHRIDSVADYVEAVKKRTGTPVSVSPEGVITPVADMREQTVPLELPTLPVLYPEGK